MSNGKNTQQRNSYRSCRYSIQKYNTARLKTQPSALTSHAQQERLTDKSGGWYRSGYWQNGGCHRKLSMGLRNIKSIQSRLLMMKKGTTPLQINLPKCQKQQIINQFHRQLRNSIKCRKGNLHAAQKMMVKFQRELKRIKNMTSGTQASTGMNNNANMNTNSNINSNTSTKTPKNSTKRQPMNSTFSDRIRENQGAAGRDNQGLASIVSTEYSFIRVQGQFQA